MCSSPLDGCPKEIALRRFGLLISMLVLSVIALAGFGCGDESSRSRPEGPTRIVVTLPPLAWAVRNLAPEGSEVTVLLQEGQSGHGVTLTAADTTRLREADHVFLVGWGLEGSVERVMHQKADWQQVHRLSEVVEASELEIVTTDTPCEDPSHAHHHHSHSMTDPHAWLDPVVMQEWVRAVGRTLGASEEKIAALVAECQTIDAEYGTAISQLASRDILTHHNAYGWLAQRYGLHVAAVLRPNELLETTPGELNSAVEAVRSLGLNAVFIEPQFSGRAAERLRELTGVRLLMLDPLGTGDWPGMMRTNLAALVDGLSGTGEVPSAL